MNFQLKKLDNKYISLQKQYFSEVSNNKDVYIYKEAIKNEKSELELEKHILNMFSAELNKKEEDQNKKEKELKELFDKLMIMKEEVEKREKENFGNFEKREKQVKKLEKKLLSQKAEIKQKLKEMNEEVLNIDFIKKTIDRENTHLPGSDFRITQENYVKETFFSTKEVCDNELEEKIEKTKNFESIVEKFEKYQMQIEDLRMIIKNNEITVKEASNIHLLHKNFDSKFLQKQKELEKLKHSIALDKQELEEKIVFLTKFSQELQEKQAKIEQEKKEFASDSKSSNFVNKKPSRIIKKLEKATKKSEN